MRTFITILIGLALLAGPATAQKKYLKKFQRQCSRDAETMRIGLGFLVKVGGAMIPARLLDGDDKEEAVMVKKLIKKVNRLKLYMINGPVKSERIAQLRQNLIEKEHMDPLIEIRDDGSTIYMLNKGKDDELGNVVVLIKDEEELVIAHLHTRLMMSDVQPLIDKLVAKNETGKL